MSRQSQPRAHVSSSRGHVDHVRHVSSPPTEGEADHVSRQSQPRAHVSGSRGLVEKRLRSPRVIPRSLKRQTTCAILRIRHVGHTREPREPDEGRVDARGRHEPKGSKWGETRRLLDTCAMSKRGQMLVSTREPRVEALSQVGHLSDCMMRARQTPHGEFHVLEPAAPLGFTQVPLHVWGDHAPNSIVASAARAARTSATGTCRGGR